MNGATNIIGGVIYLLWLQKWSNLIAKSPVFSAMFSGAFSESESSSIALEGSSSEAVSFFVNFIQGMGMITLSYSMGHIIWLIYDSYSIEYES